MGSYIICETVPNAPMVCSSGLPEAIDLSRAQSSSRNTRPSLRTVMLESLCVLSEGKVPAECSGGSVPHGTERKWTSTFVAPALSEMESQR